MIKISASAPPAAATGASAPAPASPVRVWLVDDNESIRTLVAELLSLQGGIECARHFSSPDELLSALASKPGPDVILLDVQMGDRNGLDAVRPIKSLTRSTRVLMFTTCFNPKWRERALEDGASDFLLKSDSMENVAARIRCPAQDPAPQFRRRRKTVSAPTVSPGAHTASRSGKTPSLWRLTRKMFGLNN